MLKIHAKEMGKWKRWLHLWGMLAWMACWSACTGAKEPDLILGQWRVFHIDRGGTIISGPQFKGTEYTFRENGTVFAQNYNGDTITSGFERRNDTLTYINLASKARESYHLDSISALTMKISAEIDGIPTTISMSRMKK